MERPYIIRIEIIQTTDQVLSRDFGCLRYQDMDIFEFLVLLGRQKVPIIKMYLSWTTFPVGRSQVLKTEVNSWKALLMYGIPSCRWGFHDCREGIPTKNGFRKHWEELWRVWVKMVYPPNSDVQNEWPAFLLAWAQQKWFTLIHFLQITYAINMCGWVSHHLAPLHSESYQHWTIPLLYHVNSR